METMMINNTNNNILWRERQETIVRPKGDKKSKLSKQQTELYLQQHKQHKPTTIPWGNNTPPRQRIGEDKFDN